MDDDGTGVRRVARFDPAEEGQEWSGIFGNAVVGPSRELELPDLSPLVGAALMGENIRMLQTTLHFLLQFCQRGQKTKHVGLMKTTGRCVTTDDRIETSHLMQREGSHTERGQFHRVQQSDLNRPVRVRAATGPVLITLDLNKRKV